MGPPQPERNAILVALNPSTLRYQPEEVREALRAAAAERGIPCRFLIVPHGGISTFLTRVLAGPEGETIRRVVAAGGDGTIGAVAGVIASRNGGSDPIDLGIMPTGTTNVLARELGIPGVLAAAAAIAIGSDKTIRIDAIEVAGRHVLTQVGVGPDAIMIRDTPTKEKGRFGRFAYLWTFLQSAPQESPTRFTLTVDGDRVAATARQIIAANVGTLGAPPFTWGPRIDPTDGVLDVCVYNIERLRELPALVWQFTLGRHRREGNTRYLRAREELVIDSDEHLLVQGDGEILGRTPITLRIVSGAISIAVARDPEPGGATQGTSVGTLSVTPSVTEDVETMMAQHSRTWVLQALTHHPLAALEALDAAIFLRVNGLLLGHVTDRALTTSARVMHYGEGWGLVILAMVAIDLRAGLRTAIEVLPALWLTMLTVNFPLKWFFRRRRPFLAFVKARVLGPRPRDFSLPSGHSAAAFAGALLLTPHAPLFGPVFYAIAAVVAIARIYLGVHYPSDVVVGAAAGMVLASIYRTIIQAIVPFF